MITSNAILCPHLYIKNWIELTIRRKGEKKALIKKITREIIVVKSVEGKILDIKVTSKQDQNDYKIFSELSCIKGNLSPTLTHLSLMKLLCLSTAALATLANCGYFQLSIQVFLTTCTKALNVTFRMKAASSSSQFIRNESTEGMVKKSMIIE